MGKLYVNNEKLGDPYIGTRDEFRRTLESLWPVWHAESGSELALDEWIEENLDENLSAATSDDLALYPRLEGDQ
jgi:hypothetical protein